MNKIITYEDLLAERTLLEKRIQQQKNLIHLELVNAKEEIIKEIKPALHVADFVTKMISPETRNNTILGMGTNLTIDIILRKVFSKSGFLLQLIAPALLKNYSTHIVDKFARNSTKVHQPKH
jgi:hypothetical protein